MPAMLMLTTPAVAGRPICACHGAVTGAAIIDANAVAGIGPDYQLPGETDGMPMVARSGTAVTVA